MSNDQQTEIQLKLHDSTNPSGLGTTPNVGGSGLNLTAVNHAVITQMFRVMNKQRQAFAPVVRQGQNRVPNTWLFNTGPGGNDIRASDLHQLSEATQRRVLHGLMSRLIIPTWMIYWILEWWEEHTKQLTEHGDFVLSDVEDE